MKSTAHGSLPATCVGRKRLAAPASTAGVAQELTERRYDADAKNRNARTVWSGNLAAPIPSGRSETMRRRESMLFSRRGGDDANQ